MNGSVFSAIDKLTCILENIHRKKQDNNSREQYKKISDKKTTKSHRVYLVESRSCIPKAPEQKRSISPSLFHSDLESELVRRKGRIGNHATLLKDIIEKNDFVIKSHTTWLIKN